MDEFNYEGEGLIINKVNGSGKSMIYYAKDKYNVGESTIHFKGIMNTKTEYIYYFLINNIKKVEYYYKGCN